MNKRLILMRHSIAENFASCDFERNLTDMGYQKAKNQSIKLENFLNDKSIKLEYCFYSSANRVSQTFDILSKTINLNIKSHKTRALYLTGIKELKNIFKTYQEKINDKKNIILISHNFGISEIVSILSGKDIYMDTADIIIIEIDIDGKWYHLLDYEGNWDIIYG